jgi:hypothetical protein
MTDKKQNRIARDGDGDGLVEDGTVFERPEGFVIDAVDGDGDGLVQDGTEFERPVAEATVVPEKKKAPKSDEGSVAWSQDMSVSVSKLVFESLFERNSRSVGLVQIRLVEKGYMSAGSDRRGWLSTGTKEALESYAKDKSITGAYNTDAVVRSLFERTPVTIAV